MAQSTVFSWKITDEYYGYLCTWNGESMLKTPCITRRIVDSNILQMIISEVGSWNKDEYITHFNELNELINRNFGVSISGNPDDYYGNPNMNSYIILTGKDGSNSKNNGDEINDNVLEKLKTYISSKLTTTSESLKTEMKAFKAEQISKLDATVNLVNQTMESTKAQISESTDSKIANKVSEIIPSVKDSVVNSIEQGSKIQEFIRETNSKMNEFDNLIRESTQLNASSINAIGETVNSQIETMQQMGSSLEEEIRSTNNRIDNMGETVNVINEKINLVASSRDVSFQETEPELNLSKGIEDEDVYMLETETIDNDDGTFDIVSTIGSEKYNIKILAFGNKLKDDDKTEGLVLASNGIKYLDKSGSYISIINGNIKLSNADGNGKLEIKKDGLYINGVKH